MGPVLFEESRVAVVASDHRLADRASISLEAFADYGVVGSDSDNQLVRSFVRIARELGTMRI